MITSGRIVGFLLAALLAGCASVRPPAPPAVFAPKPWAMRLVELQQLRDWHLAGRAAVALGTQGWQATLEWRQQDQKSEMHLAGPFGAGALTLELTPAGLSLNGAPPSDAMAAQLQERLGFELPLGNLRYWLLGVPDPSVSFELTRNEQDRALLLSQADWTITYEKYLPSNGDLLPGRLVMTRADARVRVVVDHWDNPK